MMYGALVGVHNDGDLSYNYGEKITQEVLKWIKEPSSFSTSDNTKNNLYLPYDESYYQDKHLIKRDAQVKQIEKAFGALPTAMNQESKMVVLTAWGGAGKTILAELYANHTWQKKYQHIWRMHMENPESRKKSITKVSCYLGIQQAYSYRPDEEERYQFLQQMLESHPNWLLILDNAKGPEDIKKLAAIHGGHILVTTRNTNKEEWQNHYKRSKPIDVLKLSLRESRNLLFTFHKPIQSSKKEKQLTEKLVDKLGYLPLALAQAGYYIQAQKNQLGSEPYAKYLEKYLVQSKILDLDEEQKKEIQKVNTNFKTVYKTFSMIMEKIEEEKQYEALRILRVMAYFNPDGVSTLFFKHLRPSRKGIFNKTKALFQSRYTTIKEKSATAGWDILRQYGLVGQDVQKFKTHRLIQEIMRCKIETKKNIKEQAVQLLETMYYLQKQSRQSNETSKGKESIEKLDENLFTLATQLNMLSHLYHMMGYIGKHVALRNRLLGLMNRLEQTNALANNFYLPPQDTHDKDLHTEVETFIYKIENPLLLITGDAGAGKSAYAAHLLEKIWEKYRTNWGWTNYKYIPLLISLPHLCTDEKLANPKETIDLVTKGLTKKGLSQTTIDNLRKKVQTQKEHLLLILDSFDEISIPINTSTNNVCHKYELDKWISPSTKIIITCRSAYLNNKSKTALFGRRKVPPQEITIAPFNEEQIDSYIKKFVDSPYNDAKWSTKKYATKLVQFPKLKEVMERPFILVIGLRTLPTICEKNNQQVTLYTVYEAFTQQWIRREMKKQNRSGMDKEMIKKKIRTFCEELAFEMFLQGKSRIEKDNKKLASFLQDPNTFQSAPLRQVKPHVYAFIQPTYRDFFAADYIISHPTTKKQIEQKVLNNELILFLTQGMCAYQKEKVTQQCWQKINQARQEKNRGIEAAYSLQLLYYMDSTSLQKKNLSGIDLQEGNLSGLDLSSCNLIGANLSRQNLTQVKLPQDLSHCNLSDAQLPNDLSKWNLTGAQLPKDLSKVKLTYANLSRQNLTKVKLPKDLSHCNLSDVQLPKNLSGYNLSGAELPNDLSHCNLSGAQLPNDLSHCDLTYADLTYQNLIEVNLPKDLSHCNLSDAQLPQDLSGYNLSGAQLPLDLSNVNLRYANLSGQNLTHVKLPQDLLHCNLSGAQPPQDLSHCDLTYANLSRQNLTHVKLPKDLLHCNLSGAQLPLDLSKFNLRYANLSGQNLTQVKLPLDLSGCNLSGAQLPLDLSNVKLRYANLSGQNLTHVKLPKNLADYKLTGADLRHQNLTQVKLPKNLAECKLTGAQLSHDLSHCNLSGAQLPNDLSHCDLTHANLSRQNLTHVKLPLDLSKVKLTYANLSGQNLTHVKLPLNLSHCDLRDAQLPKNLADYKLTGADLTGQDLTQAKLPLDLSSCYLTYTNLSGQNLTHVKLRKNLLGCNLSNAQLPQDLSQFTLTYANLSGQNLTHVKLPQDLSHCKLSDAQLPQDLSKVKLTYANLSGQNLTHVKLPQDLSHCKLSDAQLPLDLSKVKLTYANLSGQNLTHVKLPLDLSSCNLSSAQLPQDLSQFTLTYANLSGQNLTHVKLPQDLSHCDLRDAQLPLDLSKVKLTYANLSGQNLTHVKLPQDLSHCKLSDAQLPQDLSQFTLTYANLSGQNLTHVKLPQDLSHCDLRDAQLPLDLSKVKLTGADLRHQNLTQVKLPSDLSHCYLRDARLPLDLSKVKLTYANLRRQDLTQVKLPQDLSHCDLRDAQLPLDLSKIKLIYADLRHQNLTQVQLPQDLSHCDLRDAQLPLDLSKFTLTYANLSGQNLTHVKLPQDLSH